MPLLWLAAAFLAGVGLGSVFHLPAWAWGGLLALSIGLAILEQRIWKTSGAEANLRRFSPLALGVLLAGLCCGALRWTLAQPHFDAEHLAWYNDQGRLKATGWVAGYADRRESSLLLRVRVERIQAPGCKEIDARGMAMLMLPPGGDWQYGDRLELWGEPTTPPEAEEFSYRAYLARRGIYSLFSYPSAVKTGSGAGSPLLKGIYGLRERAYLTLNRIFPQPEAALLAGILLGLERDLPDDLERAFQDTGTAHIIAISGFNMAVLSALFVGLFRRFFRRGWAALLAAAAISFYTLLVGANPAVVRAAIMGSLALFGRLIGRSSAGLTPLAFSAAVMCLFDPHLPWDVSFQLSFTATLGLVLYAEPLQTSFEDWAARRWNPVVASRLAGPVSEYILFTLAAQVTTLPVTLVHFQRLSLSTLLANPLILPAQPLVMILGGIALIAGLILPVLGQALGYLAWPLTAYTIRTVELLADIPSGVLAIGQLGAWSAWGYYALLFGLILPWKPLAALRKKLKPAAVVAGLALLAVVLWSAALRRPDGQLHLTALDLPDGQALLIHTPGGSRVLLGGAPAGNALASQLGREGGPLRRHLDALVIPFASASPLEGLPLVVERMPVAQVYWAAPPPEKRAAQRLRDLLIERGIPETMLAENAALSLDKGLTLRVLSSGDAGAALKLEYGGLRLFWPGGAYPEDLPDLSGSILLLSAADWKETSLETWQRAGPQVVVAFGLPSEELPPNCLSTAHHGRVEIISDGETIHILAERP